MKTFIRQRAVFTAIAALAFAGASALAQANPIVSNIDATFGSGAENIFFVVDWNDGQNPDSRTWQLNFDSGAYGSVYEAMVNLELLDSALNFTFNTDWGDPFLEAIAFDDGIHMHHRDTTNGENPRDWWSFWSGDATGSTWEMSGAGVSLTSVVPGKAYGFSYEADWNHDPSAPNAIPEPNMIALFVIGLGVFTWLRRRF